MLSLYCAVLSLLSADAHARVPADRLSAPPGYHWRVTQSDSDPRVTFRLVNQKNLPTRIYFIFDREDQSLLESEIFDPKNKLLVPMPGRTIWNAHLVKRIAVETNFLKIIKYGVYKMPEVDYFDEKMNVSTIEDFIAPLEKQRAPRSLDDWIEIVQSEIEMTRADLIPKYETLFSVPGMQRAWSTFDEVEPIANNNGFGAFNLHPLKVLKKYGRQMLDVFESISKIPATQGFDPISWSIRNPKIPADIRIAVIELMTHNHLAENYFALGVAYGFGVRASWNWFSNLNALYARERHDWFAFDRPHKNKVNDVLFKAKPIEDDTIKGDRMMDVSIKSRLGMNSVLPMKKMYHFYGAFAISLRYLREHRLANCYLMKKAARGMALAYKLVTKAANPKELDLMYQYYDTGSELACKHLALFPRDSRH